MEIFLIALILVAAIYGARKLKQASNKAAERDARPTFSVEPDYTATPYSAPTATSAYPEPVKNEVKVRKTQASGTPKVSNTTKPSRSSSSSSSAYYGSAAYGSAGSYDLGSSSSYSSGSCDSGSSSSSSSFGGCDSGGSF